MLRWSPRKERRSAAQQGCSAPRTPVQCTILGCRQPNQTLRLVDALSKRETLKHWARHASRRRTLIEDEMFAYSASATAGSFSSELAASFGGSGSDGEASDISGSVGVVAASAAVPSLQSSFGLSAAGGGLGSQGPNVGLGHRRGLNFSLQSAAGTQPRPFHENLHSGSALDVTNRPQASARSHARGAMRSSQIRFPMTFLRDEDLLIVYTLVPYGTVL